MSTKPEAGEAGGEESAKKSPVGKKLILIGGVGVLVLALIGGGAVFFLSKKKTDDKEAEEVVHVVPKGPPTFLPLENMVVNLADPGGEKVAQVGVTLELSDAKAIEKVKMYLPSIRSGILLLISQRTAEELLLIEGKESLDADILKEAARPFAASDDGHAAKPKKDAPKSKKKSAEKAVPDDSPVRGVHFSSFIVQ
ncbi:MAG: flagellar basal body-associated FliL family protein [Rhodoferax sp.]|nr:flagellar basal body-associated FliL family protein [Rhodoferax sp.]